MKPHAQAELPPRPAAQVDLRELCRALGHYPQALPAPSPYRRRIRCGDRGPIDVRTVPPLATIGTSDGVQRRWLLGRHDGRPVTLEAVSAGVIGPGPVCISAEERLYVAGSVLDAAAYQSLPGGIPVVALDGISPHAVTAEASRVLDDFRRELERRVITDGAQHGRVLVDGPIRQLPEIPHIVGVVKTLNSQLLGDEAEIEALADGQLSTPFRILPDTQHQREVWSAYLRLHAPRPLDEPLHGIVRLEADEEHLLGPLAGRCLADRQSAASGDPRWSVHLRSVALTERVLRSRMIDLPT